MANSYAGGRYSDDLAALYPNRLFYVAGAKKIWTIDGVGGQRGMVADLQILEWAKEGHLLFQCPLQSRPAALAYDDVVPAKGEFPEGLFRARPPAGFR